MRPFDSSQPERRAGQRVMGRAEEVVAALLLQRQKDQTPPTASDPVATTAEPRSAGSGPKRMPTNAVAPASTSAASTTVARGM